ncbi:hypothetical protein phiAS5_ORF0309 [Aeromonas phage phiAS5]|uniref:Uncharacterized protein n=1 Tax=Aeromonas phage phiAS5 TaxID=879630 RepID=E1A263_9CAUD|nr:hypothetical protein phiAS5_ORF0309 [Aeromonas phage phiAS5]ADM80152.1 hypothetical protein phiAS5_ORF0309 [Aeromonas phage phiAS5]BES53087.1 hypothetical protein [Aeromonas phage phiWae14]
MSKESELRFTLKELKRMVQLAEENNTTLVDVKYTSGCIGSIVMAKPVCKDGEFESVTDVDSW